ncbi:MAG: hypothetical protein LC744_07795, partial [Chloroflexi bacterium]|nr:hypothetical protein [Chloroflexota bacterium]
MMDGASPGVDRLLTDAGLNPADGVQVVAGQRLGAVAFDPSLPLILLAGEGPEAPRPTLPGRHAHTGPRAVLLALYPASHELLRFPDRTAHALESLD